MALDRTSGFDMLIQISEAEINTQVATAFANGQLFPPSLVMPVNNFGITGTLSLNFLTPVIDLDRPRPQIGITAQFANSQLDITSPVTATLAPLGGTILIVDAVQMIATGGGQQAVVSFTNGAPAVTVTFDAPTVTLLTPILAGFGVTIAQAQNILAGQVLNQLVTQILQLPITPVIPVSDDDDPLTASGIEVTTVNDNTAADRDALTFGVRTGAGSGGNINGVTQSFIPAGGQTLVMMSNFWLLARVVRPMLAGALGLQTSDFNTPLMLNHPVAIPGQDAVLTSLEAHVEGNSIRVNGSAAASGTGWSATATFTFLVHLAFVNGQIQITASEPDVETDVDLEWWVWLLTLGLGAVFGGVAGVIVAAIVLAIVEAVAEGIVDNLAIDAFNNAVGSIPPIPLGPIGAGLTLTNLILDDLELHGPIVRSLGLPVKNSGSYSSDTGFTIDLDNGQIHSATNTSFGIDLDWDPATGFDSTNSTGFTVTGASYGSLTPKQLEKMSFATHHLPANNIPYSWNIPLVGIHDEIVFGVQTNESRYAKVRAWKELTEGGKLHMHWITYDRPMPSLDIAVNWQTLEASDQQTPYAGAEGAPCTRWDVSRRCVAEAWPRLLAFPVNYQWCLCGQVLQEGDGVVQTSTGTLEYTLKGRRLEFTTHMGQSVNCELCVSAIDARNHELFTCIDLVKGSTDSHCNKPFRPITKPKIEFIPCDPLDGISIYESVLTERVQEHIQKAIDVSRSAVYTVANAGEIAKKTLSSEAAAKKKSLE
jgi:hypothetical protein